jgi:hypothetical protein
MEWESTLFTRWRRADKKMLFWVKFKLQWVNQNLELCYYFEIDFRFWTAFLFWWGRWRQLLGFVLEHNETNQSSKCKGLEIFSLEHLTSEIGFTFWYGRVGCGPGTFWSSFESTSWPWIENSGRTAWRSIVLKSKFSAPHVQKRRKNGVQLCFNVLKKVL